MLKHVLIIPDGNRRYAKERGLSYEEVYDYAVIDLTTKLIKFFLIEKQIHQITIYGVSLNNILKRNSKAIEPILESQVAAYDVWLKDADFKKAKVSFNFIGELSKLPTYYQKRILELENQSPKKPKKICNILVAYDTKVELIKSIEKVIKNGKKISKRNLDTFLKPKTPIDLVFRSGFEKRLSGAPMLHLSEAELIFTDYYYPELDKKRMGQIIEEYNLRKRRFGE